MVTSDNRDISRNKTKTYPDFQTLRFRIVVTLKTKKREKKTHSSRPREGGKKTKSSVVNNPRLYYFNFLSLHFAELRANNSLLSG
jgi:hypothetical protein